MKQIELSSTGMQVPAVVVGCMRMDGLSEQEASRFIAAAMDHGANFFDHADIYGGGECESLFARAAKRGAVQRESMILQSKCGIRPGEYCFDKDHIILSVDRILERLQTDYLDILLLHRPDALMEPDEVAEAFHTLQNAGKVREFGVSNMNPYQIRLLEKSFGQKLIINQLQLSITNASMISAGMNVNTGNPEACDRDGGVLDYCRLNDITIQAWSPFQYGFFEGVFLGNDKFPELNRVIDEIAGRYGVSNTTVAAAWILRHPANMQVISGTMKPSRLEEIVKGGDIRLTREEWYGIYRAAGYPLP